MSVDDLIPECWDKAVELALDTWQQGHLLRMDAGAWLAPAGRLDVVTGQDAGPHESGSISKRWVLSDTGYYSVVSQTCDIAATGPGQAHPFVQVCPVRDVGVAFAPTRVTEIRRRRHVSWVYLTNPPVKGADWAVDLRVSIPISKAFLVESQPIEGFSCEADQLVLAEAVAEKACRPAMHEMLSSVLVPELRTCAKRSKGTWREEVEQFRITIVKGTRLAPRRVRLVAVTFTKLSHTEQGELRNLRNNLKNRFAKEGIVFEPVRFRNVDLLPADEYRDAVPLSVPELDRGDFS